MSKRRGLTDVDGNNGTRPLLFVAWTERGEWCAQCLSYDGAGTGKKSIGYKELGAAERNVAI